jgi:PAS domain S-box-containing protein
MPPDTMTGAQEALRESEERFRQLFENAPDPVIIADTASGEIIGANAAASRLLGMPRESIIGLHQTRLHPPRQEQYVRAQFEKCAVLPSTERPAAHFEALVLRSDGAEVPVEISAQTINLDGRKLLYGVFRDITRRVRVEQELRETERRYHNLLESVNLIAVMLNPEGMITFCNQFLLDLTGWKVEEVLRKSWFELFVPDERVKEVFLRAVRTGDAPVHYENPIRTRSGEERLVQWSNTVLRDLNGSIIGTASIGEDITDRKKMEEELLKARKLESVGVLAGGIAHDFNNLLMAIMGNISLAKMHILPADKASRLLTEAEGACDQARDLSFRLLTFSKGGGPLRQPVSLPEVLRDAAGLALGGSAIVPVLDFDRDLAMVDADAGQLKQVIYNLAVNAREAMPEGGSVTIRAQNVTLGDQDTLPLPGGEYAAISVQDQGTGIAKEHLDKIFDPYFTTKEMGSQKGRGLGLSICHSIVKKHDGLIIVESVAGKGTTFRVYLPVRTRRGGHASQGMQPSAAAARKNGARRFLVMDDEERVRQVTSEMLTHLGHDVETVADGQEAVEVYQQAQEKGSPFDCVVLDLTVPGGIGGIEALKMLQEADPWVCAIVSTGYAGDPILANYAARGFAGALAKPYSASQLENMLKDALEKKNQSSQS